MRIRDEPENLCDRCKYAQVIVRQGTNRKLYDCSATSFRGRALPVEQCSEFMHKQQVTLSEMKDIAWLILTDKKNAIGFIDPKKMSDDEKQMVRTTHLPGKDSYQD